MLQKLSTFLILIVFIAAGFAQASERKLAPVPAPINGSEVHSNTGTQPVFSLDRIGPVRTNALTFTFQPTGVFTVYDLQSNGVTQEIWQDPLNPLKVHATFMYSTVPGFATRQCAYIYSDNGGQTWTNLGDVPSSGRAGFPAITGYPNVVGGSPAIITNHNTSNGTTARAKINYDAGPGFGVFTEIDPGLLQGADGIWARVLGLPNTQIAFVASINGQVVSATNVATNVAPPGIFSGYVTFPGDQAETYCLALAPNGRVGHAYIGAGDGVIDNDVFYRFSTDNGLTWSTPTLVWDFSEATDSLGCLRGISMAFGNNNEPYVAFNLGLMTLAGNFDPAGPSSIRVWSPAVNGGIPKIVADQTNIPFFPNLGLVNDAFLPICRPSIGRSSTGNQLFMSMVATTGEYSPVDTCSFYAGWFSYSNNNGSSWAAPERMTPAVPKRDWRFISVSPVNNTALSITTVQMMAQDDSLAGTHVNGAEIGSGQAMGIKVNVSTSVNNISSTVPSDFNLSQNYPNPFNPSTSIRFDIRNTSNITLKVYNSNGQEVAILVNNELVSPGTKEVVFDATSLSSGIYFYTLFAGDFKETKKMMLIK